MSEEHVDSPDCECWRCAISRQAQKSGVCVVHAVGRGDDCAPATAKNSRICVECEDRMRADLMLVVSRWDAAQDALHPGQGSGGRQGTRTVAPLPIKVDVVDALRIVSRSVWRIAVALVDEVDDIRLPADQSTPSVAEWLAKWQMVKLTAMGSSTAVLKMYWLAADAAGEIAKVTAGDAPAAKVEAPDTCNAVVVDSKGDHVKCGEPLSIVWEMIPTDTRKVVCPADPTHMIAWDSWLKSMSARKPRGARPRNHAGI